MLRFLLRSEIDTVAWDTCVAASAQRIVYGYSWYLDAVLPGPSWRWTGLVLPEDKGGYCAVLPVPLRRKFVAGVAYDWVVHQPLFCQFLTVFSPDATFDPMPFVQAVQQRYRYGSVLCLNFPMPSSPDLSRVDHRTTHVLDLSADYPTLARHYTRDRQRNLRRAKQYGWTIVNSTDPEPLLTLFRTNHADGIDGGVGDWAYDILRHLIRALHGRGRATLRYALSNGQIEAGALFVREGNRIIYLFNAASETGRRGNARTLLIDQVFRENAGQRHADKPVLFDFESPQKPSVVNFYRSFGAVADGFCAMRWNRLTVVEKVVKALVERFR